MPTTKRCQTGDDHGDETLATDEQFTVEAGFSYRAAEVVELYLNVRNLLDDQYIVSRRPFGARPNAPRWVVLGVKATL